MEGALASGQPLILVHEGRAGRGAAPFAEIIARTPQRLRQLGLYAATLAVPFPDSAEHRRVSLRLVLERLGGALPAGRTLATTRAVIEQETVGGAEDVAVQQRRSRFQMVARRASRVSRASAGAEGGTLELLSSHPAHDTRIDQIRGWIPEALRYYKKRS